MKQLAMKATVAAIPPKKVVLPEGYRFANYDGEDAVADWKTMMFEPPVPKCTPDECWHNAIELHHHIDLFRDMFFIINPEGKRVASVTLISRPDGTGYVHMVKAMSSERGKGLGKAMAFFAIETFRERGNGVVYLTTDDFRIPAIKTYLDAGFCPILYSDPESDMQTRWDDIIKTLNYKAPVTFVTEEYEEQE